MEFLLGFIMVVVIVPITLSNLYKGFRDIQLVNNTAKESGRMVERPKQFLRQHHIFTTTKDVYKDFNAVLDKEFLSELGMGGGENTDETSYLFWGDLFKPGFKARLSKFNSDNDGKYHYVYSVDQMNPDHKYDAKLLNILLTEIEKTFIKLDKDTVIKRELGDYKSKTRFFV